LLGLDERLEDDDPELDELPELRSSALQLWPVELSEVLAESGLFALLAAVLVGLAAVAELLAA